MSTDDRRLTRQGQERKQQLLDEAARLFAERGYSDTRVVDIVKAAGVAKGLFYWYFENKEALFRELVEQTRLRIREQQSTAIDPAADPLVRIRHGAEASVMFMGEQRRLYSMFEMESLDQQLTKVMREGADVHVRDTARNVREGIDQGLIRDEDPMALAYFVVGTVAYLSHQHRLGRIGLPIPDLARFIGRQVVRGLAATEEIALAAERAPSPAIATAGHADAAADGPVLSMPGSV